MGRVVVLVFQVNGPGAAIRDPEPCVPGGAVMKNAERDLVRDVVGTPLVNRFLHDLLLSTDREPVRVDQDPVGTGPDPSTENEPQHNGKESRIEPNRILQRGVQPALVHYDSGERPMVDHHELRDDVAPELLPVLMGVKPLDVVAVAQLGET